MKPPQPRCNKEEVVTMQKLLKTLGLKLVSDKEVKRVLALL